MFATGSRWVTTYLAIGLLRLAFENGWRFDLCQAVVLCLSVSREGEVNMLFAKLTRTGAGAANESVAQSARIAIVKLVCISNAVLVLIDVCCPEERLMRCDDEY